jgi:hypothetical protein
MTNESFNLNNLSRTDIKTLLECLLFSSSVDVCANWYLDDVSTMVDLSKKIREKYPDILTESVFLNDSIPANLDENTDSLVKYFPEIVENTLNID